MALRTCEVYRSIVHLDEIWRDIGCSFRESATLMLIAYAAFCDFIDFLALLWRVNEL